MGHKTVAMLFACAFGLMLTVPSAQAQTATEAASIAETTSPQPPNWVQVARDGSQQPPMSLPWPAGERWIMSGGPHANTDPKIFARAAIDFAPQEHFMCYGNTPKGFNGTYHNVLATAPGMVTTSGNGNGEVSIDLDGDGDTSTGWVIVYYHIEDTSARAKVGDHVKPGDVIGNPGCSYGSTNLEHVHIFRKFDGEHIAADDRETPLNLSGWTFQGGLREYSGSAYHPLHGAVERNGKSIVSDNSQVAYALMSKLDLSNIQFSGQTISFRIPGSWFKPDLQITDPDQVGAFVEGRLKATDKDWVLPVASQTLSSAEEDHTGRGSVNAWDLSAKYGAAVFPISPGTVTYAGCNNDGNYGCWTLIKQDDGYSSLYAHLIDERDPDFKIPKGSAGDPNGYVLVKTGQKVSQWDPIGRVGWTGYTGFGPHVHLELFASDGTRTRIAAYFDKSKMVTCDRCKAKEWVYDVAYNGRNRLPVDTSVDIPVVAILITLLYCVVAFIGLLGSSDKVVQKRPVYRMLVNSFGWHQMVRLLVLFGVFTIFLSALGVGSVLYVNAQTVPDVFSEMMEKVEGVEELDEVIQSLSEEFPNLDFTKLLQLPVDQRRVAWATYVSTNTEIKIPWMPVEVMRWAPEITAAAKKHGIDPEFLAIVCWVESKGDPKAGSHAGAQGLVQVVPGTAAEIARKRRITSYDIWDPATNLDFGAYYLSQQLKSFERVNDPDNQQSVELAAIAYNGGPGRAQDYIAGREIPSETQRYLKLVGGMWRERHQVTSRTFLGM